MPTEWTVLQGVVAFILTVPAVVGIAMLIYAWIAGWEGDRERRRNSQYVFKGYDKDSGAEIYLELPKE